MCLNIMTKNMNGKFSIPLFSSKFVFYIVRTVRIDEYFNGNDHKKRNIHKSNN